MESILLATDSKEVFSLVDSALASKDVEVFRVESGQEVIPAVQSVEPDYILLDLQIGNMGGIASCIALRQEERSGRMEPNKIGLLLDRKVDEFLAKEAKADAWLVKPLTSISIKKLIADLS